MSIPAKEAATQEEQGAEPSFTEVVNKAVEGMTKNAKGDWELPEGLDEPVRVAAVLEKRRRDTQSDYTRISQENKALKAEKAVLLKKATGNAKVELTTEQAEELEELKFSDPEAWRKKVNSLEQEALNKQTKDVEEEVKKVSVSSLDEAELERRKEVLIEFLKDKKDFTLDDDIIANDIPPRIVKKLADGKVSFEDFLQECYDYTKTGKVIKQDKVLTGPDLGKVGGGNEPGDTAVKGDAITSYKKETY